MADARVKIAKDKAELVKALKANDADDTTKPFQSYIDVLVFAAALGAKRNQRKPFSEYSSKPDPILHETYKKYDKVINLLAVVATKNPRVLADTEEDQELRVKIFEEYANAGLDVISNVLKGSVDDLERVLLFLADEKQQSTSDNNEYDLSRFIPKY